MSHVGQPPRDGWPVVITAVRQRGPVAFLVADFHEGYYRPLAVPPFLHLVYVPGATDFLGLKLDHMLFGFNVEIADLNAAGIF